MKSSKADPSVQPTERKRCEGCERRRKIIKRWAKLAAERAAVVLRKSDRVDDERS